VTNDPQKFDRAKVLEGLAAMAVTLAEMGFSETDLVKVVGSSMANLGLTSPADVRDVAGAISQLPQPVDESADVRDRRQPINEMLGLTSPEDQLVAALRAREALEAFAAHLDSQS
jgi:hypothetical protein